MADRPQPCSGAAGAPFSSRRYARPQGGRSRTVGSRLESGGSAGPREGSQRAQPPGDEGLGGGWIACYRTPVEPEAHIVKGFLRHYGVPCVLESSRFRMEPVNFSALGEVRVLVPPEWGEVARGLIAGRADARRKESGR